MDSASRAARAFCATSTRICRGVDGMRNVRVDRPRIFDIVQRADRPVRRKSGASGKTDWNASACGGDHFGLVSNGSGRCRQGSRLDFRKEDRQECLSYLFGAILAFLAALVSAFAFSVLF